MSIRSINVGFLVALLVGAGINVTQMTCPQARGADSPTTTEPPVAFTPAPVADAPPERIDTTYQWSIPMPSPSFERRAYLWIPPQCKRVRGVVVGLQNMLEKLMFQNGDFRDACAAADIAIVYIAPGSVTIHKEEEPALALSFKDPKAAIAQLQDVLNGFASASGYQELRYAPLIPVGHSAATPFVWGYTYYNPDRCIACIPYKGWTSGTKPGVPYLHVASEYGEVGGPKWGISWKNDRASLLKLRASKSNPLMGEYVEFGNGHFAWQPASGKTLGMFIRKTVAARVPTDAPADAPVVLKPLPIESGVLVDQAVLGTPQFRAYPYADYTGDKKAAYWYIDSEMAEAISSYMAAKLAKKPEVVDFLIDGKPAPLDKQGMAQWGVKLQDDGISWKVQACFLDKAPPQLDYGDQPLGHASAPVYFHLGSGALKQVGPDTFRVWLGRGGIERQGDPWDPWVIVTEPGDDTYRSADRPIHFWIDIKRKDGKPQKITFLPINDVHQGDQPFKLRATADSGLPVQYYVVSGPVDVADDGTVTLLSVPPASKFPVKATIGAYQWGHGIEPKVASADPVIQEFSIQKAE